MGEFRIGIGSYTYTWAIGVPGYPVLQTPMSAMGLLERADALGAKVVQYADNLPLHLLDRNELLGLAAEASKRGIVFEVGAKGLTSENLERYIELAELCGSRVVRFVIDGVDYTPSCEEVVGVIRPFVGRLEKGGLALALENHDRLSCLEFVSIVERCNSANVGICLDTVNSFGALEGMREVIDCLLPYTLNLHIKDFTIGRLDHKMGFKVEGRPAGKGELDIPGLLNRLNVFGRCSTAVLELWTPYGPTMEETIAREDEWAVESMSFLSSCCY